MKISDTRSWSVSRNSPLAAQPHSFYTRDPPYLHILAHFSLLHPQLPSGAGIKESIIHSQPWTDSNMTQISPKRIRDAATELQSRKRKERREVLLTAKCKTEWKIEEDNLWMMKVFSFIGFCSVITWAEWSHSNYWDGWGGGGGEIPKRTRVSSREDWLASETAAALWTMVLWRGQWARPLDLQDWQTETRQPDFKPRQRSFKPISKGGYTIPWLFYTFPGYRTGKIKLSAIVYTLKFGGISSTIRAIRRP